MNKWYVPRDEWQHYIDMQQEGEEPDKPLGVGQYRTLDVVSKCENCGADGCIFIVDWTGAKWLHDIGTMYRNLDQPIGAGMALFTTGREHVCATTSTGESQRGRVSDLLP